MAAEAMAAQIEGLTQRLVLSEQHAVKVAQELESLRNLTDAALREANAKISRGGRRDWELVNTKSMEPWTFSGKATDSWKQWAKKSKAYCNARQAGFRKAMDWAEAEVTPIDADSLNTLGWEHIETANAKLHDWLMMVLADDPLVIVENFPGQGFEAWRALSRRYDPVGDQFTFDRMTSLMQRKRCKDISELPSAIEKWMRDLSLYEKKTGKTLAKEWRVPILFQMVPEANYSEIKARWQLNTSKDITTFAQDLVIFATELRHEQGPKGRGHAPMDLDNLGNGGDGSGDGADYTQDELDAYAAECQAGLDWVGKAGGKGGKRGKAFGKGGKAGGKGKGNCHWCNKPGHVKSDCPDLAKYKRDKDEDRKKKGLPPFKPRSVSELGTDPELGSDYVGLLEEEEDCGCLEPGCNAFGIETDDDEDGDFVNFTGWPGQTQSSQPRRSPVKVQNKFSTLADDEDDSKPVTRCRTERRSPRRWSESSVPYPFF